MRKIVFVKRKANYMILYKILYDLTTLLSFVKNVLRKRYFSNDFSTILPITVSYTYGQEKVNIYFFYIVTTEFSAARHDSDSRSCGYGAQIRVKVILFRNMLIEDSNSRFFAHMPHIRCTAHVI